MTETPAEQPDPFPSEQPAEDYPGGDTADEVVRPEDNETPDDEAGPDEAEG